MSGAAVTRDGDWKTRPGNSSIIILQQWGNSLLSLQNQLALNSSIQIKMFAQLKSYTSWQHPDKLDVFFCEFLVVFGSLRKVPTSAHSSFIEENLILSKSKSSKSYHYLGLSIVSNKEPFWLIISGGCGPAVANLITSRGEGSAKSPLDMLLNKSR